MGELGIRDRVIYEIRRRKRREKRKRKGSLNMISKFIIYLIRFLLSFLVIMESIF